MGRPVHQIDATDWTAYYDKPFFLSHVTRPLGVRRLVSVLKEHGVAGGSFLELGGGNSCIYQAVLRQFKPSRYVVVDANELGLKLLRSRANTDRVELVCRDLLVDDAPGGPYDVVISIGLIEHFDEQGTRTLVQRHFEAARPGGHVLITFPTPTRIYRLSRRISEGLGMWRFPDERPLAVDEVLNICREFGQVLYKAVGRWTPFTQAVVLAKRD